MCALRVRLWFAVTETVPVTTTAPDHDRVVVLVERTTVFVPSANFQLDTDTVEGVTVHVTEEPRVMVEGQLRVATFMLSVPD